MKLPLLWLIVTCSCVTFLQAQHAKTPSYIYGFVGGSNEQGYELLTDAREKTADIVYDRLGSSIVGIAWGAIPKERRYREIALTYINQGTGTFFVDSMSDGFNTLRFRSRILQLQFERGVVITDPGNSGRQLFWGCFFRPVAGQHRIIPGESGVTPVEIQQYGVTLGLTSRVMMDLSPRWWLVIGFNMGVMGMDASIKKRGNLPGDTLVNFGLNLDAQLRLGVAYRW
jgi:hypothetical protein